MLHTFLALLSQWHLRMQKENKKNGYDKTDNPVPQPV